MLFVFDDDFVYYGNYNKHNDDTEERVHGGIGSVEANWDSKGGHANTESHVTKKGKKFFGTLKMASFFVEKISDDASNNEDYGEDKSGT